MPMHSIKPEIQKPTFPATYQTGDQVEVRGAATTDGDYHWHGGYFVIVENWDGKEWWYGVSRLFTTEQLEATTQTTRPILYPESLLRKPDRRERIPPIVGHFTGKTYFLTIGQYWRTKINELPRWVAEQ